MSSCSQNPLEPHRSVRPRVMTELSTRSSAAQVPSEASAALSATNVPNLHWTSAVKVVLRRACYFVLRRALFWRDYYQVLRELDGLSELDLRDMRVTRAEIPSSPGTRRTCATRSVAAPQSLRRRDSQLEETYGNSGHRKTRRQRNAGGTWLLARQMFGQTTLPNH
jgi:uncharacterized protein YjiS (DUF1127 family)